MSRRAARAQRIATGEQPVISDAHLSARPAEAPKDAAPPAVEPDLVHDVPLEMAPTAEFELIEPVVEPEPAPEPAERFASEPVGMPRGGAFGVDEFEAAARLFAFTGENAVQHPAQESSAERVEGTEDDDADAAAEPEASGACHRAPRRVRRGGAAALKRAAATTFSIGVVGVVGLLTVGMTTPAEAVAAVNGTVVGDVVSYGSDVVTAAGSVEVDPDAIQAYVAPVELQNASVARTESYATVSMAEVASEVGVTNPSSFYVNDPNAAIQWPFAVGVGITFGFGMRDGRMHEGADFVPGNGAHVQAIADGTVRIATNSGGAYGVTVVIDHIIDGQLVSSRYAHMQYGSLQVSVGQHVTVGTFLGRTGNTGRSFGAHTHVEILKNGTTPIDPIAWLRANAGRDSLG